MSIEAIFAAGVVVVAALVAAAATIYTHRSSARREDRKQAREAFYAARTAWDQSQSQRLLDEAPVAVLAERLQGARRELSRLKSILGDVATDEFECLLSLLALPLLDPEMRSQLEEATILWSSVEAQVVSRLSEEKPRGRRQPMPSSA